MDTLLYDLSVPMISSLQHKLQDSANLMQTLSVVFDPKYAFLIYSPLVYLVNRRVGKKLILTTVITEWLNMILKWLLHGERPYWYVHSSGHFDAQQVPIHQFPITCELGPGHPSGHAMVTAAVWYIILDSLVQAYSTKSGAFKAAPSRWVKMGSWSLYLTLIAIVSLSRVFLGCHFPHQCLAGALLGCILSRWASRRETKAVHFVGVSLFVLLTALGTFGLLQALGLDPAWTIKLATEHCVKREYIHLDTAPFFSIMRYSGFALGSGLGLMFPLRRMLLSYFAAPMIDGGVGPLLETTDDKDTFSSRNLSWLSAKLLMAIVMARLVDDLALFVSHSNLTVFYASAFLAYTLFSFAFINLGSLTSPSLSKEEDLEDYEVEASTVKKSPPTTALKAAS